jgi:hypothetical protein
LRGAAFLGGASGVRTALGTLEAHALSVEGTADHAIFARGGTVSLEDFVLRDGLQQGLRAEAAHVRLVRGAVRGFARHGVALLGNPARGGGFVGCTDGARGGPLDCVDRVTLADNGVAALYVEGTRDVEGARLVLAATRLAPVTFGVAGDGLFVGTAARVALDPDITEVARRGFGTAIVANARVGALVQGTSARLTLRGALVAANEGGGVLFGRGSEGPMLGENLIEANRVGGVIATPGALVGIMQCNGIVDTAMGSLATSAGVVTLGDALQLDALAAEATLRDNLFSGSARFGLVLNATRAFSAGNRGADNRYGVGLYAGSVLTGGASTVLGREQVPASAPALLGAL